MPLKFIVPFAGLSIFVATAQAQAPQFEDIATLDHQVAAIAMAQPIDTRLKLARCPQTPIISPPTGGAVIVRCNPLGWRIMVPTTHSDDQLPIKDLRVRKGDAVELIIDSEGFEVSAQAIAMQDGATGDDVRVKTLTGAVILTGQVTHHGTVRVLD